MWQCPLGARGGRGRIGLPAWPSGDRALANYTDTKRTQGLGGRSAQRASGMPKDPEELAARMVRMVRGAMLRAAGEDDPPTHHGTETQTLRSRAAPAPEISWSASWWLGGALRGTSARGGLSRLVRGSATIPSTKRCVSSPDISCSANMGTQQLRDRLNPSLERRCSKNISKHRAPRAELPSAYTIVEVGGLDVWDTFKIPHCLAVLKSWVLSGGQLSSTLSGRSIGASPSRAPKFRGTASP